ncbi:GNAT family N-acetyltransferase [Glutamicibacter sp.]|uniref:GNAT family N-acetyltransferase n=1 Tax=Glutamicibacter sp. TaxID=1931995 RepID=UPI002FE2789F
MEDRVVLREWTSIDEVPDLLDVWRSSVEGGLDFLSAADLDAVATALEAVYSQSLQVRIAEQGKRILGFSAWDNSEIRILWVRHEARHQGVGRELLKHITEHSPEISVQLDTQRLLAIEFFQTCGFLKDPNTLEDSSRRLVMRHRHSSARNMAR